VSPTGRWTTLVPLIFILSVSALKEIVEDVVRILVISKVYRIFFTVTRINEIFAIFRKDTEQTMK